MYVVCSMLLAGSCTASQMCLKVLSLCCAAGSLLLHMQYEAEELRRQMAAMQLEVNIATERVRVSVVCVMLSHRPPFLAHPVSYLQAVPPVAGSPSQHLQFLTHLQAEKAERDSAELADTLRSKTLEVQPGTQPRPGTLYEQNSAELARAGALVCC